MTGRGRISLPVLLGIATVLGVSSPMQAYWLSHVSGDNEPMRVHLFVLNMVYWYVPALLPPIIMSITTRYQIGRGRWHVSAAFHLAGALAYSIIHTAATL